MILEVQHVSKNFGRRLVLDDINFTVSADKILIMRHGSTVEFGTREQIFNTPQELYTQELIEAASL